jgi:glycosyltransferase involved in cell wall biosynthesis
VITCTDSGGPTEFVQDGVNGWLCEPQPAALAAAINAALDDRRRTARMGDAGHDLASTITWDGVIEKLVG